MELKNFFKSSSNNIYSQNIEFLEEYDLVNSVGSPNRLFLKFIKSKNINIRRDKITEDVIHEFESSIESINLKLAKIQKRKETIFKQRKVWINVVNDDELIGSDLLLDHEGVYVTKTSQKILYSDIEDIEISEGGWSKKRFTLITKHEDLIFEINEELAIPFLEILEDNIDHNYHNEIDELLELYERYDACEITLEELEARKHSIYNDIIYCTNCGFKLDLGSAFCSNCGFEVLK